MSDSFADVHIAYPIDSFFTYHVPEGMELRAGMRVMVSFAGKTIMGYTALVHSRKPEDFETKDILSIVDEEPIFDERLLDLCRFTAESYCSYTGEALAMALPSGKKGSDRYKAPPEKNTERTTVTLTPEQKNVIDKINEEIGRGRLVH
ncbi:MAG: hypothetical protein LBT84_05820, partial [Spirochaetia bacterium]|nr:hypothetical protein [Spirochaetia bacterium]